MKNCPMCKTNFNKPANYSPKLWKKRVHCSRKCAVGVRRVNDINCQCKQCGIVFNIPPSTYNSPGKGVGTYCSRQCKWLNMKGKQPTCNAKGLIPWNKGKKWSAEAKKKMSEAKKGKPTGRRPLLGKTPWNKGKKCPQLAGENSHLRRGGITSVNKKIRNSTEYKFWREAVFARDSWICQECGQRGGELEADHIKPFALYLDLRLDINNGRTLCKKCHRATDTYGYKMFQDKAMNSLERDIHYA